MLSSFRKALLLLALSLPSTLATAAETQLTADDGVDSDAFGTSIAVSGSSMIAGAPGNSTSKGAAYIFENANGAWSQYQKLSAADGVDSDKFGASVSISGDYAVVGAPNNDGAKGAAYVFQKVSGNWTQTAKLIASNAAANDKFGTAVSLSGDTVVIGAPGKATGAGAVYVFKRTDSTWDQAHNWNGSSSSDFGSAVCISGNYIFVGAPTYSTTAGRVSIYKNTNGTWASLAYISGASGNKLGTSIASNGTLFIVGSPGSLDARIYAVSSTSPYYSAQTTLNGISNSAFGSCVAIDAAGSMAVIGAPGSLSSAGKVHVFKKYQQTGWAESTTAFTSVNGKLGACLALDDGKVLMGAPAFSSNKGLAVAGDIPVDSNLLFTFTNSSNAFDGTVSTDSSSTQNCTATLLNGNNARLEYLTGYENCAIKYEPTTSTNAKLTGMNVNSWGKKFTLEARIYKGDEATGAIDLVKSPDCNAVRWYIDTDGKMKLSLNGGTDFFVASGSPVIANNKWTKLYAVVDLTKTSVGDAVKFYSSQEGLTNYFGDGSNGDCTISANTSLGSASNDMIVYNFKDFTISQGATLTITAPKGCAIYASGNVNIQGTLRVIRAHSSDPTANTTDVPSTGLKIARAKSGGTATGLSEMTGCGSAAIAAEACQETGNRIYTIPKAGDAYNYSVKTGRAHNYSSPTNTTPASCFGGGDGDIYFSSSEGGGLLLLFAKGNLTISSTGKVDLSGKCNPGYWYAGGGAGIILYGGILSKSGAITCGEPSSDPGSYCLEQISSSEMTVTLGSDSIFQGTFASGTGAVNATDAAIDMLQRSGAFTLKCDFIKISPSVTYPSAMDIRNMQGWTPSATNYVSPSSSSSVIVDPATMLRRVINPPSDFVNGVARTTVAYDYGSSVFYGMFELSGKLDKTQFNGAVWVDVYIQRPEDSAFKKIGQIQTTKPTDGSDWTFKFYWNSRAAAYEWTEADAQPYRTDGPVRFKFAVR